MIRSLIAGGALSDILLFIVNIACLGFFEFPWMGVTVLNVIVSEEKLALLIHDLRD